MSKPKAYYYTVEDWGSCLKCGQYQDRRFGLCFKCAGETTQVEYRKILKAQAPISEYASELLRIVILQCRLKLMN